ncbi:MAG: efflux RND transporter periplasmic adaptor subunit [bacterium]|nr:efflux RND transporter periplasmic adaptor subunit [bacterium]
MIDASTEIMVIMDLAGLWIDAEVYEKDFSRVRKEQEVEIVVPAYPREHFHGKIHYIGDVVHSETRTITVRTKVDNKDFRLKPGMFADIKILTGQKEKAIIVPKEAVLDDGGQKIVFVREHDHYSLRPVQTGAAYNGDVEILKGLSIGENVVVEGNFQLKSRLQQESISHGHTH